MAENWKDIPGYEGIYKVSDKGNVHSSYGKGRTLRQRDNGNGYLKVELWGSGKRKNIFVHRLVLLAFVGPSSLQVNHKDGNKTNNRLSNLEYCTRRQNIKHASDIGLLPSGERHGNSKLTKEKVRKMRHEWADGQYTKEELAEKYGVTPTHVGDIIVRKWWRNV